MREAMEQYLIPPTPHALPAHLNSPRDVGLTQPSIQQLGHLHPPPLQLVEPVSSTSWLANHAGRGEQISIIFLQIASVMRGAASLWSMDRQLAQRGRRHS